MIRDDATLSAYERLVEALAADLLDAAEDEVLATHSPAACRVAADALRQRLRRAASEHAALPSTLPVPSGAPAAVDGRPGKKP